MTVNKISQLKLFAILNLKKKGAKRAQEKNNEDGEGKTWQWPLLVNACRYIIEYRDIWNHDEAYNGIDFLKKRVPNYSKRTGRFYFCLVHVWC